MRIGELLGERCTDATLRSELLDFFNECDLVKFAKYRPEQEEVAVLVERARTLIDRNSDGVPSASDTATSESEVA